MLPLKAKIAGQSPSLPKKLAWVKKLAFSMSSATNKSGICSPEKKSKAAL
ncbi:hypothetical protein AB6G80_00930 [Providencia hangzhouensis]